MATYAGDVAAQIDRLVIAGHSAAAEWPDPPAALADMRAHPGLLNTGAIVLLDQSIGRDDLGRVVPYLPPQVEDALIENNVAEGVLTFEDGRMALSEAGKVFAAAVVKLQEDAIGALWRDAASAIADLNAVAPALVDRARAGDAPSMPSAFHLFAAVISRPAPAATALRTITAMRYWRADAHRAALAAAGLSPFEAHALNRVWDAHRKVERVGQGRAEPGKRGLAAIELRGLGNEGVITAAGIELREAIEADTNTRTEPMYDALNAAGRARLLEALRELPSET